MAKQRCWIFGIPVIESESLADDEPRIVIVVGDVCQDVAPEWDGECFVMRNIGEPYYTTAKERP